MIKKIKKDVWQLNFKEFGSCVYLIDLKNPILIDTSSKENEHELINDIEKIGFKKEGINSIILTHTHWDHVGNLNVFPNAKIYSKHNIKELEQEFPMLKVIETPGHTRDSICILYRNVLFSGDSIFNDGYIGRTDLPESDPKKMQESLEKIKKIKYKYLCPGHLV